MRRAYITLGVVLLMTGGIDAQVAAPVDVCALLPREEATKILGRSVSRARPAKRADGGMECRYTPGLEGTITIMVNGGTSKAKWDAFMKELRTSGAVLEPVPGIGDGANFWDTRLYTHIGDYEVAVSPSPMPGASAQKVKADAAALAKAVVEKLKR